MDMNYGVGDAGGRGCAGLRGIKGWKWDNLNSIVNKIYLKRRITFKLLLLIIKVPKLIGLF